MRLDLHLFNCCLSIPLGVHFTRAVCLILLYQSWQKSIIVSPGEYDRWSWYLFVSPCHLMHQPVLLLGNFGNYKAVTSLWL